MSFAEKGPRSEFTKQRMSLPMSQEDLGYLHDYFSLHSDKDPKAQRLEERESLTKLLCLGFLDNLIPLTLEDVNTYGKVLWTNEQAELNGQPYTLNRQRDEIVRIDTSVDSDIISGAASLSRDLDVPSTSIMGTMLHLTINELRAFHAGLTLEQQLEDYQRDFQGFQGHLVEKKLQRQEQESLVQA